MSILINFIKKNNSNNNYYYYDQLIKVRITKDNKWKK